MWPITLKIARYKPGEARRVDTFQVSIDPERTILDAVEKVWAAPVGFTNGSRKSCLLSLVAIDVIAGAARRSVAISQGPAVREATLVEMRSELIWSSFTETRFSWLQSGGSGGTISAGDRSFPNVCS